MKWSTDISEFENKLPNTGAQVEKAFELYERLISKRRGKTMFLAGETGSGRGEALKALAESFPEKYDNVQVISGKFTDGKYLAISAKSGNFNRNIDVVGNILAFLAKAVALKTGLPIDLIMESAAFLFDFIGQLLQTSASVKSALDEIGDNPPDIAELPFAVKKLLRAAAKDSPVVCLFENFDEARIEWHWFIESIAEEIDKDLPVLFFASLRGKSTVGKNEEGETKLEQVTRRLIKRDLAEWWYLQPMTRNEIAEWIGLETEPGITGKLHGVTGGIPRWVKEIWRDWKTNEFVRFSENHRRWEWSRDKQTTTNIYNDVFNSLVAMLLKTDDEAKLSEAREILATAALEGTTFTGEALDLAIDGKDEDYVIDLIDDHFVRDETNPHGILQPEGFLTFETEHGTTRNLYRYTFISDWHWQVLNRYAMTDREKEEKSRDMLDALKIVYEGRENIIARPLSRLFQNVGDKDQSKHFETMASYASRREVMYQQAKWLMTLKTEIWDEFQHYHNAKFLLEVGKTIRRAYPYDKMLEIFEHSLKSAYKAKSSRIEASAQYYCGLNYYCEGEYKTAKERSEIAQDLYKTLKDKAGIAISLTLLARIAYHKGDYKEAKAKSLDSLKIKNEIGHKQGIASSFILLAHIAHFEGDYKESKAKCLDSLEINNEIRDRHGIASCLDLLSKIFYEDEKKLQASTTLSLRVHILSMLGDPLLEKASENFNFLADEAGYSEEQVKEIMEKARIEYEKDGARSYIEELLKEL